MMNKDFAAESVLRYPVLLVHGMGFRDRKHINYWGRIPRRLEKMGCRVFYGEQDSNGSVEDNAQVIAARLRSIAEETGCGKVNIIAHSKGGLEARYAVCTLGAAELVASLTTINTPHNGSKTVDRLLKLPVWLVKAGCGCADLWFRILGDKKPKTYAAVRAFTTEAARIFNEKNPDDGGIYYRSYAFTMKNPFGDMFMWFSSVIVWLVEGRNDGFLPPEAVKHGDFRGVFTSVTNRGISHCDQVDMRRRRLTKKRGEGVSDIVEFYEQLIRELGEMGF